jgi:hypothetical protein
MRQFIPPCANREEAAEQAAQPVRPGTSQIGAMQLPRASPSKFANPASAIIIQSVSGIPPVCHFRRECSKQFARQAVMAAVSQEGRHASMAREEKRANAFAAPQ